MNNTQIINKILYYTILYLSYFIMLKTHNYHKNMIYII